MSVSGCRSPWVSRSTLNASRYSGSASSCLPWACSSFAFSRDIALLAPTERSHNAANAQVDRQPGPPRRLQYTVEHRAEVAHGDERVRVLIAQRLARHLQRLAQQRLGSGEVVLGVQQVAEVVDAGERVCVPIAEGLARHRQRLAQQRLSGDEITLGLQQGAEVADGDERFRMPIAERLAPAP
eukprot:scaffold6562_cov60-Phaeocystis_antarctica.AAC.6